MADFPDPPTDPVPPPQSNTTQVLLWRLSALEQRLEALALQVQAGETRRISNPDPPIQRRRSSGCKPW